MFKDGISSLKNTPGCDRAGMVFALATASLTRDGHGAFSRLDKDITRDISYTLEMMLCYWAWLKQDTYWKTDSTSQLEIVKNAVSTLLDELVSCVPISVLFQPGPITQQHFKSVRDISRDIFV